MPPSSDTGLEAGTTLAKKKPTKKRTKPTAVAVAVATDRGANEGDDPRWAYAPPEGAQLLDHAVDAGEFEWGAVKNDNDAEIWLMRVPDAIKAEHLKGLEIDPPSSSRTARIGGLTKKNVSYDVWSMGDGADVGAEELRGLSCLLPRKRKGGKLYIAPKEVSHHIVISARPPTAATAEHPPPVYQNPPRPSYPKDMLKHAFVPYGARSQRPRSEDASMAIDDVNTAADKSASTAPLSKDKPAKTKESKRRKRSKGADAESPKKSKKHKPSP